MRAVFTCLSVGVAPQNPHMPINQAPQLFTWVKKWWDFFLRYMRDARKWKKITAEKKDEKPFLEVFCLWKIHTKFSFHSANDFTWRRAIFHFQKIFWIFYFAPSSCWRGGIVTMTKTDFFIHCEQRASECYCFTKWKCENLNIFPLSSSSRIWVFIPLVFSLFVSISPTYRQIKICEEVSTSHAIGTLAFNFISCWMRKRQR